MFTEGQIKEISEMVNLYADDEMVKMLDSSGLGNHPVVLKFLHKLAEEVP